MSVKGAADCSIRVKLIADYFYLKRQVIAPLGELYNAAFSISRSKTTEVENKICHPPFFTLIELKGVQ